MEYGNVPEDSPHRLTLEAGPHQVWRTRKIAIEMIEGDYKEQYWQLRDYSNVILKRNPGRYVRVTTNTEQVVLLLFLFAWLVKLRQGENFQKITLGNSYWTRNEMTIRKNCSGNKV